MTARRTRRRLVLSDDGIIDPIAVDIAARGARPLALTPAERQLAARILARGGTLPAAPGTKGGSRMTHPHKVRRRQRAMAARQALSLCEAELPGPTWDGAGMNTLAGTRRCQPRISVLTARTALRAAGLPPQLAAELRSRLRLVPEPETKS